MITNGTAVLGLGNIGPLAGKPVMEGKACLFKKFADIDVFDLEVDAKDADSSSSTSSPRSSRRSAASTSRTSRRRSASRSRSELRKRMRIPVFHDDQHGTAIISGAALLNAAELAGKKLEEIKVVVSGAGAAAIACANFFVTLGVRRENIMLVDSKGVITRGAAS